MAFSYLVYHLPPIVARLVLKLGGRHLLQKIAIVGRAARSDAAAGEHDRAASIASNALALIRSLQLPATPRVYELCYAYATGEYPMVKAAINNLLNRRVAVSLDMIEQIAAKYVSRGGIQDELVSVGSRVAHEVEQVLTTLDRTDIGSAYDDFVRASAALSTTRHTDALLIDVKELQRTSIEIGEEKRKLEAQLNASNAELASLRAQLQKLQSTTGSDPVTGLPNRHEFKPLLKQAIGEAAGRDGSLCLLLADIDAFTSFNESWGYDRGDQVLCLVAMEIRQKVNQLGTAVRSGGAQFAVILPDTPVESVRAIAEQVRSAIMQREVMIRSTGEKLGRIGMSFGIASARRGDTTDSLTERTDENLRSAKMLGGNRVVCENDTELTELGSGRS